MTRAAAAEAAAAAKARLRALLDAAPPPRAPPPGSAEAALLAGAVGVDAVHDALVHSNCTNGEDAVLASVSAVRDVDHAAALRLLRALQATGEVQLAMSYTCADNAPAAATAAAAATAVVHSAASIAAALAAVAAMGAGGLPAPSHHAPAAETERRHQR